MISSKNIKHKIKFLQIEAVLQSEDLSRSPMARQYAKLVKSEAAFNLAISISNHELALPLAKDLCKSATRYHFPKFIISSAAYLMQHYTMFRFNRKKALLYKRKKEKATHDYLMEEEVGDLWREITLCQRSSHSRKNVNDLQQTAWNKIKLKIGKVNSIEYHRRAYYLGCRQAYHLSNWSDVEKIAEEGIEYMKNYELSSNASLTTFYRYRLESKIAQKTLANSSDFLQEYENLFEGHTINWFNYNYTLCRFYLDEFNIDSSEKIIEMVQSKASYKRLPDHNKVVWQILEAFINYINLSSTKKNKPKRMKIGKLLNSINDNQITSKAEQFQLRLLQVLYFLKDKKWSNIEDNTYSTLKFLERSKLRINNRRSYLFTKMLLEIPKNNYHSAAIKRHTTKYSQYFKNPNKKETNMSQSIEIIPYEYLWEMIMENLKK